MKSVTQKVVVRPKSIVLGLYSVITILLIVHSLVLVAYFLIDDQEKFDFVRIIDLDYESNIPTLFSAFLFFLDSMVLLFLWRATSLERTSPEFSYRWHWMTLAVVFVALGFDEGIKLHEYVGDMMENVVDAEGFLYFPWFIPYTLVLAVLTIVFLPFFFSLPINTRYGFTWAAVVFLLGAVVLDIVSAREADLNGTRTIYYSVVYTIEETLEMIGLVMFFRALTDYAGRRFSLIELST